MLTKFVKHCLTGKDNKTYDIARVLWALGVLSLIGYSGWIVFHDGAFDPQNYGIAFGLIMGAGGGSIWAKAKTEPPPDNRHEYK